MTYNLGVSGMSSFHAFIGDIKAHQWSAAANDARNSLWCRQVRRLCKGARLARGLRSARPGALVFLMVGVFNRWEAAARATRASSPKAAKAWR
jgi:hypothetical protein